MNPRRSLRDRRSVSSALITVLAVLVVSGVVGVAASAAPPQNAASFNEVGGLPTISGAAATVTCPTCGADNPRVGDTLTAASGAWSQAPPPFSFAYEWKRCAIDGTACTAISGATGLTYKVAAADVTHVLVLKVTALNKDGSGTATSLPTGIAASANGPLPSAVPTLTGSVIVGKQLGVSSGVWTPTASSYAIQWQRCSSGTATAIASGVTYTRTGAAIGCLNVAGATNATYGVTAADLSHRIRVIVTATISTGDVASAISNTSGVTVKPAAKKKKR